MKVRDTMILGGKCMMNFLEKLFIGLIVFPWLFVLLIVGVLKKDDDRFLK